MLSVQTDPARDLAVLTIAGHLLGGPETQEVRSCVSGLVGEGRKRILVNLERVPYMNSLAIGALVAAYVTAKRAGTVLEICCPSSRVEMMLRVEKIIPLLFDPYSSEAAAIAGFATTSAADHPAPR